MVDVEQLVIGCKVHMFTISIKRMVLGKVKLDSFSLLDLGLLCCLEPSLDLLLINSEFATCNHLDMNSF